MLTPSEVRELIDYQQVNDDDEPGLLKLLDHFARMYSTDSSREGIEAALRECGFDRRGKPSASLRWVSNRHSMVVFDSADQGFVWDCRQITNVGELLHLVAAAEMAQEGE